MLQIEWALRIQKKKNFIQFNLFYKWKTNKAATMRASMIQGAMSKGKEGKYLSKMKFKV